MQPGSNAVEGYNASRGGDGLRVRDELPEVIARGHQALTPAEKDLLKWGCLSASLRPTAS